MRGSSALLYCNVERDGESENAFPGAAGFTGKERKGGAAEKKEAEEKDEDVSERWSSHQIPTSR